MKFSEKFYELLTRYLVEVLNVPDVDRAYSLDIDIDCPCNGEFGPDAQIDIWYLTTNGNDQWKTVPSFNLDDLLSDLDELG